VVNHTLYSNTPIGKGWTTPKRPADDLDVATAIQAAGIKDDDWIQKLLEVDKEQLTLIASLIVNKSNIDNRTIKKTRTALSTAKWTDFAARAGLPEDPGYLKLGYFETPVYLLPPSFHKAVFESSWHAQDVYQEAVEQTRGGSRLGILDPVRKWYWLRYTYISWLSSFWQYLVSILALFQGRIIDKPEEAMPATAFATGGEVEHKVRSTSNYWKFFMRSLCRSLWLAGPNLHLFHGSDFFNELLATVLCNT
jgi:hypothetical protein